MAAGDDEDAAIAAQSDRLAEKFNNGDHAGLIAMHGEEATLLPPGPRTFTGRREVQSFWQQARQIKQLRFETGAVRRLGDDAACEIGNLHLTVGPQSREVAAKYVLVWRKAAGQWEIETMIWNATGGQGRGAGPRAGMRGRGGGPRGGGTGGGGQGRGGPGGGRGGRGRQPAFVPRVE